MPVEEDILPVLAKMRERRGVDFTQYRESTLRRRLARRLLSCDCADVAAYLSYLDSTPEEYDQLLSDLTIKYTEFFRDFWVFNILRQQILPEVFSVAGKRGRQAAIWSAGCATGEEAYTLAAILLQLSEDGVTGTEAQIIATDVDPWAIEKAEVGVYSRQFVVGQIPDEFTKLFEGNSKNITSSPRLKGLISFHVHDLTLPSAAEDMQRIRPGLFDLILCRNVLMYLRRPMQTRILKLCGELLEPEGYLVIGTKEMIPRSMEDILAPVDHKAGIYRGIPE